MKFQVNATELKSALNLIKLVLPSRPSLPVLSHIKIEADAAGLYISTTSLDQTLKLAVNAKVEVTGEILVPYKRLTEMVALVPTDKKSSVRIEFEYDERENACKLVWLDDGSNEVKLPDLLPTVEFPVVWVAPKESAYQIWQTPQDWVEGLETANVCAAKDDSRPILCGVNVVWTSEKLVFAAADGYRLAEIEYANTDKITDTWAFSANIPLESSENIIKLIKSQAQKEDYGQVFFSMEQDNLFVKGYRWQYRTSLNYGTFPDYPAIIPQEPISNMTVWVAALEKATKKALTLSKDFAHAVKFETKDTTQGAGLGTLTVTGKSMEDKATMQVNLDVFLEGETPIDISLNGHYVVDMCKATDTDKIIAYYTASNEPMLFHPELKPHITWVIMPMSIGR